MVPPSSRFWWFGIVAIVAAIAFHAAFPRYEWRIVPEDSLALVRLDRWMGRAQWGMVQRNDGRWKAVGDAGFEHPRSAGNAGTRSTDAPTKSLDSEIDEFLKSLEKK
jgi:hypothetical protein